MEDAPREPSPLGEGPGPGPQPPPPRPPRNGPSVGRPAPPLVDRPPPASLRPPPRRPSVVPVLTMSLIALNLLAHLLVSRTSGVSLLHSTILGSGSQEVILAWEQALRTLGWNQKALVLGGEPQRLITAAFLHAGIIHLGCNLMCLWNLGMFLEMAYGARRLLLIYVGSALAGSLGTILGGIAPASVGASGAVFGLIGCGLVFSYRYRKDLPPGVGMSIFSQLFIWAAIFIGFGWFVPMLDNFGHLGGLIGGLALTPLVGSRFRRPRRPGLERALANAGFVLAVAVLVAGAAFMIGAVRADDGGGLERRETIGGFSLVTPPGWTSLEVRPELVRLVDEDGEAALTVELLTGGEAWARGGRAELDAWLLEKDQGRLSRRTSEQPERFPHRLGPAWRVIFAEGRSRLQYYIARGDTVIRLAFDDDVPARAQVRILLSLKD